MGDGTPYLDILGFGAIRLDSLGFLAVKDGF